MRGDRGVLSSFSSAKQRREPTRVTKTQRRLCARESLDTHEAQLAGRFALAVGHLRDDELEIRRVGSTHWKGAHMGKPIFSMPVRGLLTSLAPTSRGRSVSRGSRFKRPAGTTTAASQPPETCRGRRNEVMSRLGLDPGALALKGQTK